MISLTINGTHYSTDAPAFTPLVEVLRGFGLTGTKVGCASGECGACTVIIDGKALCSCLMPVGRVSAGVVGTITVETIEGIGTMQDPHPLQSKLHERGAFQCGFCTPGVMMSLIALLRCKAQPDQAQVRAALQGNVCRCSGYKKLLEAVDEFVAESN